MEKDNKEIVYNLLYQYYDILKRLVESKKYIEKNKLDNNDVNRGLIRDFQDVILSRINERIDMAYKDISFLNNKLVNDD